MTDPAPADPNAHVLIIGAGHAGGSAAAFLRQFGHAGPITLVGEEAVVPYQRPPLSKALLKGEQAFDALKLKPESFYEQKDITLRLGERAEILDASCRTVTLKGGEKLTYDLLILATGSSNRRLPIAEGLAGVHELRSIADAEALKAELTPGARLLIVGGGYIGLEAAASARALGAEATVIEREGRVLARVASQTLSDFFTRYHRDRGVEILTGASVAGFEADEAGRVRAASLEDGRRVECDLALIGVGARACDDLARSAGLACDGGVIVDAQARTRDPRIFAIGDMTLRPMPLYEDRMFRLESVPNALEQARQAASAITGRPAPKPEAPWFWSDQYDLKLQIAGVPFEADAEILRGDPAQAAFSVFHLKGGAVRAVEAVNAPADFMGGRLLLMSGAKVDPARLADPDISIKEVAAPEAGA